MEEKRLECLMMRSCDTLHWLYRSSNELSSKLQCLPSTVYKVPALRTSAAFAPHSLKLVEEWGFVLRTAGTYAFHLRGQNLANAVSALLHPEHGTLYRYISVRQPSADNSSSLGSKVISLNAPTYDFYLRELLSNELTYFLTYLQIHRSDIPSFDAVIDRFSTAAARRLNFSIWTYTCTRVHCTVQ